MGSWADVEPLQISLRDPRERLLKNLEKLTGVVDWKLPPGRTARIAPELLIQIYSEYGTMAKFAEAWIRTKELEKNHVANEMLMIAMVLDRMVLSSAEFITSEGCEILASRIYALRRAFADVRCASDWRLPKGANPSKWRSKVRWDLANAVDMRVLSEGDGLIRGVEADISKVMQERALFAKYLDKGGSPNTPEEENK